MKRLGMAWAALDTPTRAGIGTGAAVVAVLLVVDIWLHVDYQLAANIALLAVAVLVSTFTVLYSVRSPWWNHRLGRIYWAKCVVLSAVLLQITLAIWWDLEYPGRQYVRFAIYGLGAVVYIPMLVSLLREQKRGRTPMPLHGDES